jgi:hypothetical protein
MKKIIVGFILMVMMITTSEGFTLFDSRKTDVNMGVSYIIIDTNNTIAYKLSISMIYVGDAIMIVYDDIYYDKSLIKYIMMVVENTPQIERDMRSLLAKFGTEFNSITTCRAYRDIHRFLHDSQKDKRLGKYFKLMVNSKRLPWKPMANSSEVDYFRVISIGNPVCSKTDLLRVARIY